MHLCLEQPGQCFSSSISLAERVRLQVSYSSVRKSKTHSKLLFGRAHREKEWENRELKQDRTSATAITSTENITSSSCNNIPIIPRHFACKMYSKYPGIKLVTAVWRWEKTTTRTFVIMSSHVEERRRTATKGPKKVVFPSTSAYQRQ